VVCRSGRSGHHDSGGRTQDSGGAVYVWDEEGWVDEGQEEQAGDMGGTMEGVGIPNGQSVSVTRMSYS
jgi:hypothetical protein